MVHGMAHDTHCLPLAMYSQPHKHRVVCYLERQYWEGELDYSPGRPVHPDGVPSPRTTHLFFFYSKRVRADGYCYLGLGGPDFSLRLLFGLPRQ